MARLFNAARRKKSKYRFTNLDLENYKQNRHKMNPSWQISKPLYRFARVYPQDILNISPP